MMWRGITSVNTHSNEVAIKIEFRMFLYALWQAGKYSLVAFSKSKSVREWKSIFLNPNFQSLKVHISFIQHFNLLFNRANISNN
jgi:hypothetical protein